MNPITGLFCKYQRCLNEEPVNISLQDQKWVLPSDFLVQFAQDHRLLGKLRGSHTRWAQELVEREVRFVQQLKSSC